MNDHWEVIARLASELHPDRIEAISQSIASSDPQNALTRIRSAFGQRINDDQMEAFRLALERNPNATPKEIAAAFLAASKAADLVSRADSVELVWTGPKTGLIPTRSTEQAILEIIDQAESRLFVVSYVFYKATSVVDALNKAVARGVRVSLLLESSTQHGGTVRGDSIGAMADLVPNAEIYVWMFESKQEVGGDLTAAVHAKCAVADEEIAFITSANLTPAALERNMELGVLLRGGTAPKRLQLHLNSLIVTNHVRRWHE